MYTLLLVEMPDGFHYRSVYYKDILSEVVRLKRDGAISITFAE